MSLTTLCIVLLCLQPFIIYWVMFSAKEKTQSDIEVGLSFLIIAPCFVYFYLDIFWYALALLSGVSALGGLLVKLFEKKGRNSIPLKRMYHYLVPWFLIFSIGYGMVNLWEYVQGFFNGATTVSNEVEALVNAIPLPDMVNKSKRSLLSNMAPSLGLLVAMSVLFLIRLNEIRTSSKDVASNFFLLICVAAALLPLLSEYYLLSLLFNFFVLIKVGGNILLYKETDPSAGAISFFYGYVFFGAVMMSFIIRGVYWLSSF